jgi:hypothetical protein
MATLVATTDHDAIRHWALRRGATPALVAASHDGTRGELRFDLAEPDESLEEVMWDEFFRIFDEDRLAFVYEEETLEDDPSYVYEFVSREEVGGGS